MSKIIGAIVVDQDACKGCGICVSICPTKVIALNPGVNGRGYHYAGMVEGIECIGCANCQSVCPDSCITVYREKIEE